MHITQTLRDGTFFLTVRLDCFSEFFSLLMLVFINADLTLILI